ncbi:single-stranded-DNA-specific exonuclease RecJ [Alteromonadaceae bacterium M269]|nr:single-stranded-DNA-specific exonuclease RecJ [Alteromonadaceae bacterium M269]
MNIIRRPSCEDAHLSSELHPKIRQIYASRGIKDTTELDRSTRSLAHYNQLKGVDAAVVVLAEAIQQQKKIIIVGDFDADGATSTALCMLALTQLGSTKHDFLVPNRFDFGYGLSPEIVEVAHQNGAELIITVDNGISCIAGVALAKRLNIDVVVTDHHLPSETLPAADAIVNPNQPGCEFISKNLAGVGVAFYLMLALKTHLQQQGWFEAQRIAVPNLANLLDIVAVGTVADVVTLDTNNRVLVHQGIQRIRSSKCRPGINALVDVAGRSKKALVASDLGFVLGPRLNAAGRLDDMTVGIQCLLTEDISEARELAVRLDSLNRERREIEASMQEEAIKTLEGLELNASDMPDGIVLFEPDWHQGVIGILAGRIKDKYFRPTIAFAHQDDDVVKGSARSIPGLHIRDLLEDINCRYPDIIEKFGGHAMAAGLSLSVNNLEAFKKVFEQVCKEWLEGRSLQGEILTDGCLSKDEFSLGFAQLLKDSGPWGQGFAEPIFDDVFEIKDQRLVGSKHLKMMVEHESGQLIDAIAFNVDLQQWPNKQARRAQLAYKLDINEFRGKVSLQLMVESLQAI